MDENKKELELSPEELKAEEEAGKEVAEDELRDKLAEEFGLDPDENADLDEKLVEKEKSNHEKLSSAIKLVALMQATQNRMSSGNIYFT